MIIGDKFDVDVEFSWYLMFHFLIQFPIFEFYDVYFITYILSFIPPSLLLLIIHIPKLYQNFTEFSIDLVYIYVFIYFV